VNTKTALLLGGLLIALAGSFFGGRSSVQCPTFSVPPGAISTAETKALEPAPPETLKVKDRWLADSLKGKIGELEGHLEGAHQLALDWRTHYQNLFDSCLSGQNLPSEFQQVFENRWPHSGDSAWVDLRDLTLTLKPFGFLPQTLAAEIPGGSRPISLDKGGSGLLLFEGVIWDEGPAEGLISLKNPLRPVWWFPGRVGAGFRVDGKKGLVFGWTVF